MAAPRPTRERSNSLVFECASVNADKLTLHCAPASVDIQATDHVTSRSPPTQAADTLKPDQVRVLMARLARFLVDYEPRFDQRAHPDRTNQLAGTIFDGMCKLLAEFDDPKMEFCPVVREGE